MIFVDFDLGLQWFEDEVKKDVNGMNETVYTD